MTLAGLEVQEGELRLFPGWDEEVSETLAATKAAGEDGRPRLVDTTMLYAPRSGGVKRYLLSKKAWLEANRPGVAHNLVVPGAGYRAEPDGVVRLHAPKLPFGDGYRWPSSVRRWGAWVSSLNPTLIEAGDPYTPGQGALEAGQRVGCPVVGFCHSDPAALAALHFGEWAKKPVEKRWAKLFSQFDRVVSPSRFIAQRLEEAGVGDIVIRPLGVEVDTFHPDRRDRDWLLKRLGLGADARLLCFAGRPAKEKNVGVLIDAVQRLGAPYHLVLVGAGAGMPPEERVISLPYEKDPRAVARIIASCDVAAAMMEAPGGTALVAESILESLDFRRAMRKVEKDFGRDWWFKVWGPDKLAEEGVGKSSDWVLKANARWHGFGALADGFNMLDPIKCTIVTPGLDLSGKFAKTGIPASIVTKFLAEHGVVVEKTGLYSFFIMFTIGITKGRWNTMLTALQQFKDDYDKNAPMWRILPEFCAAHPRYERMGLRDLCQAIHETYAKGDIARLTTEMYLSDLHPAMKPTDAFARIAHRETERVPIDALEGRITTSLLTPYPPGIPLLIPGERFNRKIVDYLRFARRFNEAFPGFDTDVHGLVEEDPSGRPGYFVDCVKA